jgi:lysophospholipase L1-like esterase
MHLLYCTGASRQVPPSDTCAVGARRRRRWRWSPGLSAPLAVVLLVGVDLDPAVAQGPLADPSAGESWSVVVIGDSTPTGYGQPAALAFPSVYGALLAAELGVEVVVINHATNAHRSVAHWAGRIRTDVRLAPDLASARAVLVWLGWHDIMPIVLHADQTHWPDPLRAQLMAKNAELVGAWRDLLLNVRSVAGPGSVILVADSGLIPFLPQRFGHETYWPELKRLAYLDWRDALIRAAEAVDAIVVPTMTALGGPDGENLHPELLAADGLHFSAAGHRLLAEQYRAYDGIRIEAVRSDDADR